MRPRALDWHGIRRGAALQLNGAIYLLRQQRRGELMAMAAPIYHTAGMVRALPDDGNRYGTVHEELLVTPAPRLWHQQIVVRITTAISAHLERYPIGCVLSSPADISWGPDILVQPDLFVMAIDEARTLEWTRVRSLLLAVEVLSPSTACHDRFTKRRLYQEVGVPDYWIVDPDARFVEVWTPDGSVRQKVATFRKERRLEQRCDLQSCLTEVCTGGAEPHDPGKVVPCEQCIAGGMTGGRHVTELARPLAAAADRLEMFPGRVEEP
ncbi:MAG: Uma2 family endonuclease [Gemmatimonadales bacterium]